MSIFHSNNFFVVCVWHTKSVAVQNIFMDSSLKLGLSCLPLRGVKVTSDLLTVKRGCSSVVLDNEPPGEAMSLNRTSWAPSPCPLLAEPFSFLQLLGQFLKTQCLLRSSTEMGKSFKCEGNPFSSWRPLNQLVLQFTDFLTYMRIPRDILSTEIVFCFLFPSWWLLCLGSGIKTYLIPLHFLNS